MLFVSSRAFSLSTLTFLLSTPVENSEATWKKATKCNKLYPVRVDENFFIAALFYVRAFFSICLLLSLTAGVAELSRDRSVLFSDSSWIVCLFFKLLCT